MVSAWPKLAQTAQTELAKHIQSVRCFPSRETLWGVCSDIQRMSSEPVSTYKASLHQKKGACPKFFRPQSVPFVIWDAVGEELDRLEKSRVLEKVSYSEWAAPIVVVPKKDGRFRIISHDQSRSQDRPASITKLVAKLVGRNQVFQTRSVTSIIMLSCYWMKPQWGMSP